MLMPAFSRITKSPGDRQRGNRRRPLARAWSIVFYALGIKQMISQTLIKVRLVADFLRNKLPSWLTQFVGELLTQDGYRGADALKNRGSEGGTDGQAIDEVVQAIAQRDHPGQSANVGVGCPFNPVAAAGPGARSLRAVWSLGVLAKPESTTQTMNDQNTASTRHKEEHLQPTVVGLAAQTLYLWCLCRTEHELALTLAHLAQSQIAGFSVLLQLLRFPSLHIMVWCWVAVCTGILTVTVALKGKKTKGNPGIFCEGNNAQLTQYNNKRMCWESLQLRWRQTHN